MKRLLVLRHAEAVPKDAADDFDRVLSARGRNQMAAVARHLAGAAEVPDGALVSPAARTRETWSRAGLDPVPFRTDERIYEASPDDLLAVLRDGDDLATSLVLVGHNPGLHDAARALLAAGADGDLRRLAEFPTACLAEFELDTGSWRELSWRTGRLLSLVTPADLGA